MKLKVCNKKIKLMFPEYRDMIQGLATDNPHFSKCLTTMNSSIVKSAT
jgi:hypothetical protein